MKLSKYFIDIVNICMKEIGGENYFLTILQHFKLSYFLLLAPFGSGRGANKSNSQWRLTLCGSNFTRIVKINTGKFGDENLFFDKNYRFLNITIFPHKLPL